MLDPSSDQGVDLSSNKKCPLCHQSLNKKTTAEMGTQTDDPDVSSTMCFPGSSQASESLSDLTNPGIDRNFLQPPASVSKRRNFLQMAGGRVISSPLEPPTSTSRLDQQSDYGETFLDQIKKSPQRVDSCTTDGSECEFSFGGKRSPEDAEELRNDDAVDLSSRLPTSGHSPDQQPPASQSTTHTEHPQPLSGPREWKVPERLVSARGRTLVVYKNCRYRFHRNLPNGQSAWRCNEGRGDCRVRILCDINLKPLDQQPDLPHNHATPSDGELLAHQVANQIKHRASISGESTRTVVESEIRGLPADALMHLPDLTSQYRMAQRARRLQRVSMVSAPTDPARHQVAVNESWPLSDPLFQTQPS